MMNLGKKGKKDKDFLNDQLRGNKDGEKNQVLFKKKREEKKLPYCS